MGSHSSDGYPPSLSHPLGFAPPTRLHLPTRYSLLPVAFNAAHAMLLERTPLRDAYPSKPLTTASPPAQTPLRLQPSTSPSPPPADASSPASRQFARLSFALAGSDSAEETALAAADAAITAAGLERSPLVAVGAAMKLTTLNATAACQAVCAEVYTYLSHLSEKSEDFTRWSAS